MNQENLFNLCIIISYSLYHIDFEFFLHQVSFYEFVEIAPRHVKESSRIFPDGGLYSPTYVAIHHLRAIPRINRTTVKGGLDNCKNVSGSLL